MKDGGSLAFPWPASGVMIGGDMFTPRRPPRRPSVDACSASGPCDGSDPVDAAELCLWPTAVARDWRSGKASEATRARNSRPLSEVAAPGGFLHPDWVDRLMGFGAGYTRIDDRRVAQRRRGSKLA